MRTAFRLAGISLEVEGRDNVGDGRNTIIVSNHVSHLDAPAIFLMSGVDLHALAKKEVLAIPFFGAVLRRAGTIGIDRSNKQQALRAIADMAASLRAGGCYIVFAEGTRSLTGELGPFKKGGFVAALEARSRIVPAAIFGTRELMPRKGITVRKGRVVVAMLDPVDAGGYSNGDRDAMIAQVRERIAAALAERGGPGGERVA